MPIAEDQKDLVKAAVEELERRKHFERFRYYKIPMYFRGIVKSDAHTKLLCCPNKVGKSTLSIMLAYWYAMGCHPYKKIEAPNTTWLMGPTIAHVNEVFLDGMREWGLDKFWKSYAEKKGKITWKSGSITYVKSYDERKNIQGRSIKTAFIDEECPDDIWNEIVFRFKAGIQMDIYVTATPLEGEEWFADLCERAEDKERGLYIAPEIAIYDAKHLSKKDISRIEALCRDDRERQVRMYGKRIRRAGAVLPLEERIHRIGRDRLPGGDIPPDWLKIIGIDPHARKPTSVIWIAIDPGTGDAYVYDHARLEGTARQQAEQVKIINKNQKIFAMYIDPAAQEAMSSNMVQLNANYFDEFVAAYPSVPLIKSIKARDFVIDAVRYRITYDKAKPMSETNRPHFYVLRHLEDYWRSLKQVRWEEYKDRALVGMKEKVKKGKEDDLMATGYALVKHPLYIPTLTDQMEEESPYAENEDTYSEMGY